MKAKRVLSLVLALVMVLTLAPNLAMAAQENEGNNTAGSAQRIAANEFVSGNLENSNDVDYYKVTLSTPGYISLTFNHAYLEHDWRYWAVTLYNGDNKMLAAYDIYGTTTKNDTTSIGVPAGTYYIKVNAGSYHSDVDYELKLNYTATDNWETEFNDTVGTTDLLEPNSLIKGSLMRGDDVDYYRVTLSAPGYISLTFNHAYLEHNWRYWVATLYDGDNKMLAAYDIYGTTTKNDTASIGVPAGTYYIKVNAGSYHSDVDYELKLNYTATDNWETEFNDTVGTTDLLEPNSLVKGSLMRGDDVDYYRVTLSAPGYISLTFNHAYLEHNWRYWVATLYDGDNKMLAAYDIYGTTTKNDTASIGVPAGTYYIKVNAGSYHSDVDYELKLNYTAANNWETEFNDTFDTAQTATPNWPIKGNLMTSRDMDYYKLVLNQGGDLSFVFEHEPFSNDWNYWAVTLYNRDNQEVATYRFAGKESKVTTESVSIAPGTYYVKVGVGSNYADTTYTLTMSGEAWGTTPPTEEENEDFVVDANGVLTQYTGEGGVVVIPEGVRNIHYKAFYGYTNLTSVTLPASLVSVGRGTFTGNDHLTDFFVASNSETYTARDGVLFNKDETELIIYPEGRGGAYVIPEGVTSIEGVAFYSCAGLTKITIPEGVTSIGYSAFQSCVGLTDVTIPEGVTSIESRTFLGCTNLTGVTIPESVTAIKDRAFLDCTGLKTVKILSATVSIDANAFTKNDQLTIFGHAGSTAEAFCKENSIAFALLENAPVEPSPSESDPPDVTFTGMHSGGKEFSKLSRDEIRQLLKDHPATTPSGVFVTVPSCKAPYAIGEVRWEALQAATDRLNALRTLAGLPQVELDKSLSENAQYGAVILGNLGGLTHRPDKPEDMPQDFYDQAFMATSTSNLAAGVGLCAAPDLFMDDSDASNVSRLGHRMWQLNPSLGKVGFGHAQVGGLYGSFTVEKVFDTSGEGCDYDFVSWPASGVFPVGDFFTRETAWSIALNPRKYAPPAAGEITVHLTREEDGMTWTFSEPTDVPVMGEDYFNVGPGGYGESAGSIIFRPGAWYRWGLYDQTYTVSVDGLKWADTGETVTDFTYSVTFFDPDHTDLDASMFTVDTADETYNGAPIQKTITGKDGDKLLEKDTDYTVEYKNNTDVGTATITITGTGAYRGELSYTFVIKKASSVTPTTPSDGYDDAYAFCEDLAAVKLNGMWGYADRTGAMVIPCIYEEAGSFSGGLAMVKKDNKYGYLGRTGKTVIPFVYDDARYFHEGLAGVSQNGKWGFVDTTGKVVVDFQYSDIRDFGEGLAAVCVGESSLTEQCAWGYIDKTGKVIIDLQYNDATNFSEGLSAVRKGDYDTGKYGFIDKTGKVIIPFQYGATWAFSEGLAAICEDDPLGLGKWGFIDKTGQVVIPFTYDMTHDFHDGVAPVSEYMRESYYGAIDQTGKEILPLIYGYVGRFQEGYAVIESRDETKAGFVDKTGKLAWYGQFQDVTNVSDGLFWGKKADKWKIYSMDAKELTRSMFAVDTSAEIYTGRAITKSISGKDGSKRLVEGADYTVSYRNNTSVGTATITITGKGDYTGTVSYTFTIKSKSDSSGGGGGSSGGGSLGGGGSAGGGGGGDAVGGGGGGSLGPGTTVQITQQTLTGFADVAANAWFYDAVRRASDKGLMKGTDANHFSPNANTTRAMVATVLFRLDGERRAYTQASFWDVTRGNWYTDAVDWAAEQGIVTGYSDTIFAPDDNVTREQLAVMLCRYAGMSGVCATTPLERFADGDNVSDWAAEAMSWAINLDIITGKDGNRLDPQGFATRAEICTLLVRFMDNWLSK